MLLRAAQLPDLTADVRARLQEWASEASCLLGPSATTAAEQKKDLWRLRAYDSGVHEDHRVLSTECRYCTQKLTMRHARAGVFARRSFGSAGMW